MTILCIQEKGENLDNAILQAINIAEFHDRPISFQSFEAKELVVDKNDTLEFVKERIRLHPK